MQCHVSLEEALEHLSTTTKTCRKVGISNGQPTDFEQAWLQSASVANCVENLAKAKSLEWADCSVLPKLARRAKIKGPILAVAVLKTYLAWCAQQPATAVDRQKQCATACKCGLHGLTLDAARGLQEVHALLKKTIPTLSDQVDNLLATNVLADAMVALSTWIENWNARHQLESTHLSAEAFAKKYTVALSTVQRWCEQGRLPAEKVLQMRGSPKWMIDVTSFPEPGESISSPDIQENEITSEYGVSVLSAEEFQTSYR